MNSQKLIVDLVRNWMPKQTADAFLHRSCELCDLIVTDTYPEYPGLEKIEGVVIWDNIYQKDDPRLTERDALVHEMFRKFAVATGTKVFSVRHVDRMTYVDFKSIELKNVTDMEWVDTPLEKEIVL